MTELCGTDYTQEGTGCTYRGEGQLLCVIAQNGTVASIEYRMITQ